jgi:hypothetical protein
VLAIVILGAGEGTVDTCALVWFPAFAEVLDALTLLYMARDADALDAS